MMGIEAINELVTMAENGVMPLGFTTRLEKARKARAELAALEADNAAKDAALREVEVLAGYEEADEHCSEHHEEIDARLSDIIRIAESALSGPPSGKVLVDRERLREIESSGWSHLDKCRACPACGFLITRTEGEYYTQHHSSDCWIAALLKEGDDA